MDCGPGHREKSDNGQSAPGILDFINRLQRESVIVSRAMVFCRHCRGIPPGLQHASQAGPVIQGCGSGGEETGHRHSPGKVSWSGMGRRSGAISTRSKPPGFLFDAGDPTRLSTLFQIVRLSSALLQPVHRWPVRLA